MKNGCQEPPYLEDVFHPPEVPDVDLDGWGHLMNLKLVLMLMMMLMLMLS